MDVQLERLVRLQEVDSKIAALAESIAALPKRIASLEQTLERQKQTVEQAEKAVVAEEVRRRRLESDLKDQQQKLVKYRDQSSSVKTNEQFHALQHEVGFVEAEIRRIEDEEIASMVQIESLDARRTEAKQELAGQRKTVEKEKEAAARQSAQSQKEMDLLRKEQAELRAGIDEQLLVQYDRLAASSRKTSLARASGQRCLACQMSLRPQFWNQVRTGGLLNCESCGRMLYFDPVLEPVPGEVGSRAAQR